MRLAYRRVYNDIGEKSQNARSNFDVTKFLPQTTDKKLKKQNGGRHIVPMTILDH